jgi:ATP-dependent RNA helicase DHX37/DHR1
MEINKNKDEKINNSSENIKEENKDKLKNDNDTTNKDTKQKISKSKKKRMIKKEKYMSIKKMEYLNRQNILNSLEQHNISNAKLASELISIKNLGQKRKREKQYKKDQNNNNIKTEEKSLNKNDLNNNNNEEMSISSSSSSDEEEMNNQKENNNTTKKSQTLINGMTPQEFLNKLLAEKRHQRELEELSETNQYLLSGNNIFIPSQNSSIIIERTPQIIEQRAKLPIISQEHDIMYSINNSLVTIICGETGSGKSTQIPQFLYEKGYTKEIGKIAITQPRRVAARSLAFRLREEMNMIQGLTIGYQVRYENDNVSKNTEIKFVTDGILLKELENDSLLSDYSVIIIDEAHERTINSDLLIGFISQILKIRYIMWKRKMKYNYTSGNKKEEKFVLPLRLIIMSATLRVSEFSENKIFSGLLKPRVVEISSRQYPVHIYHSKKTENDYIEEAFKYCCKIHSRLPEGNVIVFLTGKREILDLCKKLKDEFSGINDIEKDNNNINDNIIKEEKEKEENNKNEKNDNEEKKEEEKIVEEIDKNEKNIIQEDKKNYSPVIVLPLYSSMEPEEQMKIYQEHKGKRMIVVSTNVAETSLTIPGVRYVIDSGRVKKRIYKSGLSFSTFKIEWISQASSNQRSGRAGRTCEGYCYRLYSNGLYVKMDKFTEPQISTSPLSQVILTLKSMKVKNIYSFPFITKPKLFFIDKSLEHLVNVGAVDIPDIENINKINRIMNMLKDKNNDNIDNNINDNNEDNLEKNEENEDLEERKDTTTITEIGKLMAKFPVEPKLGKILIMANNFDLVEYAILIVAILSIENLIDFTSLNLSKKEYKEFLKELNAYNNLSDILTYLSLVILTLKGKNKKININSKKITELKNLSNQLISLCKYNFKKNIKKISEMSLPTHDQEILLLQIFLSSFIDNIARKRVLFDSVGNEIKLNAIKSNKKEEQIIKKKIVYECNENNKECKIYNYSTISETLPEYLIYTEIISENNNNFLHLNSCFNTDWLYNLGGNLVKTSLSLNVKEPYYNKKTDSIYCLIDIIYGYKRWEINNIAVEMNSDEPKFYYYFARFLLEGEIIDELKKYKKMLNSNPNIITNKVSDMYIKVSKLIVALKGSNIKNKDDLENKIKKDKNFLKDVLIMWYDNPSVKKIIREKWPFLN